MKLLISKSGRFISKHLQNRSNPYEGKVARRMNENTIPERTHGEITRKENAVIPRDYSVYGTPEQARTAGVPLRRRTLYPAEVQAHGIKLVLRGECSNTPLGEQIIALCMVRLVRWDVPNSLIYRGFCRMTLSCRDAQYHVFHSFSQRPISKILAKAKSRLSKNVPRWVSLCKLIITNPTLKNQGSDLFIG